MVRRKLHVNRFRSGVIVGALALVLLATLGVEGTLRGQTRSGQGIGEIPHYSVVLENDRAYVHTGKGKNDGSATAYRRDAGSGVWEQDGTLPDGPATRRMSYAVATGGDYAVVGAQWHDGFKGAAYVLERDGDRWVQVQTLSPPDLGRYDHFGSSVAIDGDNIVVSAPWQDAFSGASYVFKRDGGSWTVQQKLAAGDGLAEGMFKSTPSLDDGVFAAAAQVQEVHGAAPVLSTAAVEPPEIVTATDAVFEDRVELTWSSVDLDAILYKITRDGVLLTVASSEDTLYEDTTGDRGVVYDYCVIVVDMTDTESVPRCDNGSRVIYPPAEVSASDGQFINGVTITWEDRSSSVEGYRVRRDGVLIATLDANAQSAEDETAVASTVYSYEVVGFDDGGFESAPGSDDGFRGVVLPPLNVSASDGEFTGSVRVTWEDQSAADDFFVVSRKNLTTMVSTVLDTTAPDVSAYDDGTAQTGTNYQYCVTALDAIDRQSIAVCDEGSIDFPVPVSVEASDSTYDDMVEITWEDPSDLEDGFQIVRDGTIIDTTAANATSYKDLDAVPDVTHNYCVVAFSNSGGSSLPACDDGFRSVVLAPTDVTASDGTFENRVEIEWQSVSTTVVLFKIYRDGSLIKTVGPDGRSYDDAGGTANREYVYGVQAVTAMAEGSMAVADVGRRDLLAPTDVVASDEEFEDRVEIYWTDRSAIESGFVVYRTDTTASSPTVLIGESNANVTSFVDFIGEPGVTYRYSVAAFDVDGESRGGSDLDDDEGRRVLGAPTGVSAGDGEFEDRVEITWADNSNVEDGYYLYRNDALIDSTQDNVTSIIDANPTFGAVSNYSVRSFDQYGTSVAGSDSGFTTILAPASFNASDSYLGTVELRWVDRSEIEEGYILTTESDGAIVGTDTLAADVTSFTDDDAIRSVPYNYRLRAFAGLARSIEVEDPGMAVVYEVSTPAVGLGADKRVDRSDADAGDLFGASVATSGNVLLVGAPGSGADGNDAYFFSLGPDLTWTEDDMVWADDGQGTDRFGEAVAMHGDFAIIGLPGRNSDYQNETGRSGLALIFQRNPDGTWYEWNVLRPFGEQGPNSDPEDSLDKFGAALAIDGDAAIVGARGDDVGEAPNQVRDVGSVYFVNKTPADRWVINGKHFASDTTASASLGASVDISGDWAIAGAPGDDDRGANSGSAFIFRRTSETQWEQYAKIVGSSAYEGAAFGSAVAIQGNVAFVGAPQNPGQFDAGIVYVFELDLEEGAWVETGTLRAGGDAVMFDRFGASLDVRGNRLVVGAYGAGSDAVYIFTSPRNSPGTWEPAARLGADDWENGDQLGSAVALGDDWVFVGAGRDDVGQLSDYGSVYALQVAATVSDVVASDGSFGDRVHIEWRDQSQSEEGVIIYRDGVEYDRLGTNEDFYDDFDAEPGRTYKYEVSAITQFSSFELERVPDFGWRPPDGHITGRITSEAGAGVKGVSVCLEPPGTGALLFDGVGGHVRIPDDGAFNFTSSVEFTIEVWFSYAGSARSPRIITKLSQTGTEERPLDLGLQRTGRLFFNMSDGVNVARVLSQRADLDDDEWHHVACVYDATAQELRLYIDGVLEDSTPTVGLGDITNNRDVYIGGVDDATWFGGQVDDLRIWSVARSESEINATRKLPLLGDEESLKGYWSFDSNSGTSVTDFAGDAQYGEFVGGVYRTDETAPLDVCAITDDDGNYSLTHVRYAENGTEFRIRPKLAGHEYSPATQLMTLNAGHPVENQVGFTDISSYTLSGRVAFAGSDCFEPNVAIFVDGKRAGISDKNGKFAVTADEGSHTIKAVKDDYTFVVAAAGDTIPADSLTLDVKDDVPDIVFLNTTKHTLSGKVGGGCDQYVGEVTVRYRSANRCLDTTFVDYPDYEISLPPMKYFASATVDPATIPAGLTSSDVISYFGNLGEREIDLTSVADTTLDFTYKAPLTVEIVGFEPYVTCSQLALEDGTPLPANLPIIPQLEFVDLVIRVSENYGGTVCPLDTGMVVIYDEIFDQEDSPDTLTVSGGIAEYRTFASTPSLIAGRTEGSKDRSYQKALTATVIVEGVPPVSSTEWALVTGRVAPAGAEFVTFTADIPLHILRDPPGDGSSAFLEKGFTACAKIGLATSLTLETGLELKTEFGFKPSTFVGAGIGAFAGTINGGGAAVTLENKLTFGTTISSDLSTEVCLSTTERFSTTSNDALVGEEGDVFIGAGINFLFTEAGTINVGDDCRVLRGTTVAFEPDAIETAYAYTESHVENVLIPELQAKVEFYADSLYGDVFVAQRDNWQDILDRNMRLKKTAVTTENRSFSAGADYEYTHQNALTTSASGSIKLYSSLDNKIGTDFDINIFGAKVKLALAGFFNIKTEITASAGGTVGATRAVGYVLSDDDIGDNFTVDIKDDGEFISPVFQVLGGKSSCPYEPWPDLETGEPNMVARDRLALRVSPQQPEDIPLPDEPALLTLTLENHSDETRDYELRSLSVSNPGGAILMVNGSPIANGLGFTIAPESAHEATLTVDRGPTRFFYQDLQLALSPACGDPGVEDAVSFNVAFQTQCSDITLYRPEAGWTYNQADEAATGQVNLILTDYELLVSLVDSLRVESVGVQYRRLGVDREGPTEWVDVLVDSVGTVETLVAWSPAADLPDGVYELRAFARCNTGGRGYSAVATGTIDRHAPLVFGSPEPSDGELSLGEDISITFNEPIDCGSVNPDSLMLSYLDGPNAGARIDVAATCNGNALVLEPQADPNDLEGRRLEATVKGVRDLVGNPMAAPATWELVFRKSLFTWSQTQLSQALSLGSPGSVSAELANGTQNAVDFEVVDLPAFLTIAPTEATGRIAPGVARTISFDVDDAIAAGVHEGQVTVIATDAATSDTTGTALLDVYFDVACFAPVWTVNPGDFEYSMSIVGRMVVDGTSEELNDPDDRLAAFVGGELRGVAGPTSVGAEKRVFLTVFSNRASNETVRFEVWDADKCKRYPGTLERVSFIADAVVGTPVSPAPFTAVDALPGSLGEFALNQGWNWFSTNIASSDMSVVNVLSSLSPAAGDIIKSKTEFASFDPGTSAGWVGTLTTLDNTSGYMIRLSDAGTVLQEGAPVDPTATAIPVASGWNWISYAGSAANDVTTALGDLAGKGFLNGGEVVKGQSDFAQWDTDWVGNLEVMEPGQGYRLFLQSGPLPGTFNYPGTPALLAGVAGVSRQQPGETEAAIPGAPAWLVQPNQYQYNMAVIAALQINQAGGPGDNYLIGAFVGDECRGIVQPMYVEGIERYLVFAMVHSDQADGETVEFRAFDAQHELVYDVVESLSFESDAVKGAISEPLVLTAGSVRDGVPSEFSLGQNHPNPFNPTTAIRFALPTSSHVLLTVFNVRGQEVTKLVDRQYGPGTHRVVWDGTTASGGTASTGVYFYKLTAGSFADVKKMVLLK